jgi:GNAT superfamily N-acetyltransferase
VSAAVAVRPLQTDERAWLAEHLELSWGATTIVSRGRAHDAAQLPALVALDGEELLGLATFELRDRACEVVAIEAFRRRCGVGSALLAAVVAQARASGCERVWLVTTNDNLEALRFYQRRGMRLVAVHPGAVEQARELKPEIPLIGEHGIPIRDEIELELVIAQGGATLGGCCAPPPAGDPDSPTGWRPPRSAGRSS